ncbi:uncharacterized protein LOC107646877 [Arachis ipaensis]|uniref:uncharacterized protein LOC107646877 n=1 Tax=Arachis ipaensis TaxID=130454 RepID=UPI0007AF358D|nr:uncharacterized protein LOC107646877 [Arachis ipaensis]
MPPRRRSDREGSTVNNPLQNNDNLFAAIHAMAEAVRETATATTRAVNRLGERNGERNNDRNGENGGNRDGDNMNHDRPMTLAAFLKVNPSKFKGTTVAIEADNWFRGIERSLREQYVEFATYMLEGDAQHWWQGIQLLLQQDEGNILWDAFKEEFYKKYFPRATREAKKMELMQLKQGSMSVAEYTRKFEDLYHFSKVCQGNPADFEEWKCLKFEGGLREDLLNSVIPLEIRNFAELVNKSQLVEDCAKKIAAARMNRPGSSFQNYNRYTAPQGRNFKQGAMPSRRYNQNRNVHARPTGGNGGRMRQDIGKRPQQAQMRPVCRQCGKEYGGRPCQLTGIICFSCGQPGHMAKDCLKKPVQGIDRPRQQGRVFAMTADDAIKSDSLIQGQCYVKSRLLTVLYDSGASHSFISETVAHELGLDFTMLDYNLIVRTPTSQNALTSQVCQQVPFVIEARTFIHDLVCLPLCGLDIILGLDWLSKHHVFLDCFK